MQKTLHSAITATATSDAEEISNLKDISIQITSADVSSGTGTISIDVSNDGTNWETDIAFINSVSTTPATRVTSLATSGDADTKFAFLGRDFSAKFIRVVCTVATDGNYTVVMHANKITT